jgi:hypothetical protein
LIATLRHPRRDSVQSSHQMPNLSSGASNQKRISGSCRMVCFVKFTNTLDSSQLIPSISLSENQWAAYASVRSAIIVLGAFQLAIEVRIHQANQPFHQMYGNRSKYSSSSLAPPSPLPSAFSDSTKSMRSIHLTIL